MRILMLIGLILTLGAPRTVRAADGAPTQAAAAAAPAPIEKVEISADRAFVVNGKPFFPLLAWLQSPRNFPAIKACGMNGVAGAQPESSGPRRGVSGYLGQVRDAGLYGVMPFSPALKGNPALLAYIHGDEPDLTHTVSDARVIPDARLRINTSNPLWKMVDGDTNSWSVLDPLQDARVALELQQPVTVSALAVWLTISGDLATARTIRFLGDGKPLTTVTLAAKAGRQRFALPSPATFKELKLEVVAINQGGRVYGSIAEVEGFDAAGKNVLLTRPRKVANATPAETMKEYQQIKAGDPTRPVFMTLTSGFDPTFNDWPAAQREQMYPEYIKATDVVGYDVYPIYGWNKPEWIYLSHDTTARLTRLAGPRPVYAWIETSKGGQYTGTLENQKPVTPADIRSEVWMAICGGATAIGYFTHVWKPAYNQFGVPEENRRALREINDQITRLTPEILGAKPKHTVTAAAGEGVKLAALAKAHAGALSIFAVNYDERKKEAQGEIKVDGLAAGTEIEVVDEGRTLKAEAGTFRDTFAPLAVHIYRVKGME